MEADGIDVNYKVGVQIKNCSVPIYHLIEILGILLDNALEAVKDTTWDKTVYFILAEKENMYQFSVQNRAQYISYSDIERLFQLGWSEKGAGRGIGLYHVKCLCDEYNCDIGCKNIEMNEENWIEFDLGVHKADSI